MGGGSDGNVIDPDLNTTTTTTSIASIPVAIAGSITASSRSSETWSSGVMRMLMMTKTTPWRLWRRGRVPAPRGVTTTAERRRGAS